MSQNTLSFFWNSSNPSSAGGSYSWFKVFFLEVVTLRKKEKVINLCNYEYFFNFVQLLF